ncbi:HNH endonuclease [Mucilaginibacter frigoritolerans]|jgi:5-methylcytosine-specific restriction endonuclease McrA|uniref:HNH endonuclease n=1 Tax=Mucilaginibacter frigoritolerans TaxID=652788 RepID=A0A562UI28_9SPHI|nr:HNH endonuclease signature motif containing protein [Mucilaginibacter frigoritolerans]TWJ04955.1 HNH endonuclease [Mucilaginibacter frigoritolerans]
MTNDRLNLIYDKTHGYCHLCHKKLAFINYGIYGAKGAWHIEHSKAKANGGTDHLNNLYAACIACNLEKGVLHTMTIRRRNNVTSAPLNKVKKDKIRSNNSVGGGFIGFIISAALGGPPLAIAACALIGAKIGYDNPVKK